MFAASAQGATGVFPHGGIAVRLQIVLPFWSTPVSLHVTTFDAGPLGASDFAYVMTIVYGWVYW
jgi:hypothetical protein